MTKQRPKQTSAKDILGSRPPLLADGGKAVCYVCTKGISAERVSALRSLGVTAPNWTHVHCSQERKRQGIFLGESGASELKVVTKVYQDSVRSIFSRSEHEATDDIIQQEHEDAELFG